MTEFGRSLPDRLVIENIGIMLTDVAKFLHKALIIIPLVRRVQLIYLPLIMMADDIA